MTRICIQIAWPASEVTARHWCAINTVELKILCFYACFKMLSFMSLITTFYIFVRHCKQRETSIKAQGGTSTKKG